MQKIRRKYEENRLFDCHVRGTICSLNEKRPWLNGINLERGYMPVWVVKTLVSIETLSPEIS